MTDSGWYPDPYGDTTVQRYFDGSQWTEHTAPVADTALSSGPALDAATAATGAPGALAPPPAGGTVTPTPPPTAVAAPAATTTGPPDEKGGRAALWIGLVVVLVLVIGAAAFLVTRRSSSTASTASTATPPVAIGNWSDLYAHVPAYTELGKDVKVQAVDVKAFRTQMGVDPNDPKAGGKVSELNANGMNEIPSFWTPEAEDRRELVAILPNQPDRTFEVEAPGAIAMSVLVGTFDVDQVTAALRKEKALGPDATVETYAGQSYLKDTGTELAIDRSKQGRTLEATKRPMMVAVTPDHVLASVTEDGMRKLIDAWAGRNTAAQIPALASAAKTLDQVRAVSTVEPYEVDARVGPASAETIPGSPGPVLVVGTYLRDGRFGPFVVAVKQTERDAQAAEAGLKTVVESDTKSASGVPYNEALRNPKITVSGPVLSATFEANDNRFLMAALLQRDQILDI